MTQPKLKLDLKALDLKRVAKSELVENLSKHLSAYEDRWKKVLKEFDHKSRDAKERSKLQWDRFSKQLKGRRSELEKRVQTLFQQETQRLSKQINQGANDLFKYLKRVAKNEKLNAKAASSNGARKTQKGARASGGNASKSSKKASAGKGGKRAKKAKGGTGISPVASSSHAGAPASLAH